MYTVVGELLQGQLSCVADIYEYVSCSSAAKFQMHSPVQKFDGSEIAVFIYHINQFNLYSFK